MTEVSSELQCPTTVGLPQNLTSNKPLSASQGSLRSVDNDSSATMSADEAPPSGGQTHREQQSMFHCFIEIYFLDIFSGLYFIYVVVSLFR